MAFLSSLQSHTSRRSRRVLLTAVLPGALAAVALPAAAEAAVVATYLPTHRTLSVTGDGASNTITVDRTAAGALRVNGGAIFVRGGTPTVQNTAKIAITGHSGDDRIAVDETAGAVPRLIAYGSNGNDELRAGSGADELSGGAGNDTLLGGGAPDLVFGQEGKDVVRGGDGDDFVDLGVDDDTHLWAAGDDDDVIEGRTGSDQIKFAGSSGADVFALDHSGPRVRVRRDVGSTTVDAGEIEAIEVDSAAGNDTIDADAMLSGAARLTAVGGDGDDTLTGSQNADVLFGGAGRDGIDGGAGSDFVIMDDGDDRFSWNAGDGADTVDGKAGADSIRLQGAPVSEAISVSANGRRVRLTRNVGAITMDIGGVEQIETAVVGGPDTVTVNDLSGTDVTEVRPVLEAVPGTGGSDSAADVIQVHGTIGADRVSVSGANGSARVSGLPSTTSISGSGPGDRLEIRGRGGADTLSTSGLRRGVISVSFDR